MSTRQTTLFTALTGVLVALALPGRAEINNPNTDWFSQAKQAESLPPSGRAAVVTLPTPVEWSSPEGAPPTPGHAFEVVRADAAVNAQAPIVFDWTKTAEPGESVFVMGARFADEVQFVVYGQSAPNNGVVLPAEIRARDGDELIIRLPPALPASSLYVLWATNRSGASQPVLINRAEAWWLGPDRQSPGQLTAVHGVNLSQQKDKEAAWIYLQAGNAPGQWAKVRSVNSYRVEFEVPQDLKEGSYHVWVHNGRGGSLGWSLCPNPLRVDPEPKWDGPVFNIRDFGARGDRIADDTRPIQEALHAAAGKAGATVVFPAGFYRIDSTLRLSPRLRLKGEGKGMTVLSLRLPQAELPRVNGQPKLTMVDARGCDFIELQDMTLDYTAVGRALFPPGKMGTCPGGIISLEGASNVRLIGLELLGDEHTVPLGGEMWGDTTDPNYGTRYVGGIVHCSYIYLKDCDLQGDYAGGVVGHSRQVFWDGCRFIGCGDGGYGASVSAIMSRNNQEMSIRNCVATDKNRHTTYIDTLHRFYVGQLSWGADRNIYMGGNHITHAGPHPDSAEQNAGEIILWEAWASQRMGPPSAASARQVTFTTEILPGGSGPNQAKRSGRDREWLAIVSGTGRGQYRKISAYDPVSRTATLAEPWTVIPDTTSKIVLMVLPSQITVYGNHIEGDDRLITANTASTAFSLWSGGRNIVFAGNHVAKVKTAMAVRAIHDDQEFGEYGTINGLFIADNVFEHGAYSEVLERGTSSNRPDLMFFNNVLRNNRFRDPRARPVPDSYRNQNIYEGNVSERPATRPQPAPSAVSPLPPPTEWESPTNAPLAPGDAFRLPSSAGPQDDQAPVIAEWNRTVTPDESFTLAGTRFTRRAGSSQGTDTTVWLWADTPRGGLLHKCPVWHVEDSLLTATVPAGVPFGMYLVWVENDAGAGTPICLNRPEITWIGPVDNRATPGAIKRVFGRNLSRGHGTKTSHVFLQAKEEGAYSAAQVLSVEPCAINFKAPDKPGDYRVYVHSGHGGRYGWSHPLDLSVAEARFVRGETVIKVSPSGTNDTESLQSAILAASQEPDGGTVRLSPGTYQLSNPDGASLRLLTNVRLLGEDKTNTVIRIATGGNSQTVAIEVEDNTQIENLTLEYVRMARFDSRLIRPRRPQDYVRLIRVRVTSAPEVTSGSQMPVLQHGEVSECEFWRTIYIEGAEGLWIHDSTFYGTRHRDSEAGIFHLFPTQRLVVERCHFATPAWPTGPGGSRNYKDFLSEPEYARLNFCTGIYAGGGSLHYWGHNTTKDVAPGNNDMNKGEMILYHERHSNPYCQVAESTPTLTRIRTDGLVHGASPTVENKLKPVSQLPPCQGRDVVIIAGTGRGQARKIPRHTTTELEVDRPWRVAPGPDSVIAITTLWANNVVYQNELNAFPEGYDLKGGSSASTGVQFGGQCWHCVSEGNVSHRAGAGLTAYGFATAPNMWNQWRNERAFDLYVGGIFVIRGEMLDSTKVGAQTLGNTWHGCEFSFNTAQQSRSLYRQETAHLEGTAHGGGLVLEGLVSRGSQHGVIASHEARALYRHNHHTLALDAKRNGPMIGARTSSGLLLHDNTWTGASTAFEGTAAHLIPLTRVARFELEAGQPPVAQGVVLANTGSANLRWQVTQVSHPWIQAGELQPELAPGQASEALSVTVKPDGLETGTHWGAVTLTGQDTSGGKEVICEVGVRLQRNEPE